MLNHHQAGKLKNDTKLNIHFYNPNQSILIKMTSLYELTSIFTTLLLLC
jgi:hypothetical protein